MRGGLLFLCCYSSMVLAVVIASPAPAGGPCDSPANAEAPFCNVSLDIEVRARDLVDRVLALPSAASFATLFSGAAGAVPELGLPAFNWLTEALHGIGRSPAVRFTPPVTAATVFPQPCTTAASFNTSLYAAVGAVIGQEGRAMSNVGNAGLATWGPMVNVYVHPQWGRGQETAGEDPFLSSEFAAAVTRGMQRSQLDPSRLLVSAACRFSSVANLVRWRNYSRFNFSASVSAEDLNRTYLVALEACIGRGGGSGLLCSADAVNGVPSCADRDMLRDTVRDAWGFDGYVMSAAGAIDALGPGRDTHNYSSSPVAAVAAALKAGVDIGGDASIASHIQRALRDGAVSRAQLASPLFRQFRLQLRLGYFDPADEQPLRRLNASDVDTEAARELALQAAREGIVLLNYDTEYLPLDRASGSGRRSGRRVAVLGPNADNPAVLLGTAAGQPPYTITPREGIARYADNVSFMPVLDGVLDESTANFTAACGLIRAADTAVLVIGNNRSVESETRDRESIALPGAQLAFVEAMASCAADEGKLISVVVLSGGSVDYGPVKRLARGVGALLWAGYPGQSGGEALADILYGACSPSGRLPHTVYPADYIRVAPMTEYAMAANASTGYPGRTYTFYTGAPVYPFAWGLTYTNWSLQVVNHSDCATATTTTGGGGCGGKDINESSLRQHGVTSAADLKLSALLVNISNVGTRPSAFSLLYKVTKLPPGPEIGGRLSDFKKVFLGPGESQLVELGAHLHALAGHQRHRRPDGRRVQRQTFAWEIVGLARGVLSVMMPG